MNDEEQKRLLERLSESELLQSKLQDELRRGIAQSQKNLEYTRATRDLVRHSLIPSSEAQELHRAYGALNDATRTFLRDIDESFAIYGTNSAQANVSVSSTAVAVFLKPAEMVPAAKVAAQRYLEVAQRSTRIDDLRAELIRCGLDKERNNNRSPLDLLNESCAAIEKPSRPEVSPTSELIPLRQCIERSILDVFNRCEGQEPGKNWKEKILSIARRSERIGIASGHFGTLAEIAGKKLDTISNGKDGALTRMQVDLLYSDGLNFLKAFLSGVDERRLRA